MFPKPESKKSGFTLHKKNETDFDGDETAQKIQSELKKWRRKTAQEMDVPPYIIFGDKTLNDIAAKKPESSDELYLISGLGDKKIEKYGRKILEIVQENL